MAGSCHRVFSLGENSFHLKANTPIISNIVPMRIMPTPTYFVRTWACGGQTQMSQELQFLCFFHYALLDFQR
jgi:hypothetical protein